MTFKDHFSAQARDYARFRPRYPDALFDWIAGRAPKTQLAWDCACGNGQAAGQLARHFSRVVATDASAAQIAAAPPPPGNVGMRVASAERSGLAARSVDAICVAQALHWFDVPRFYAEAQRVAVSGAVLVVWMYGSFTIDDIDPQIVRAFEHERLASWWPDERAWIDDGYASVCLPGSALAVPSFAMTSQWSMHAVLGYVGSWSAVARCRAQTGVDPLPELAAALAPAWGEPARGRTVRWPLVVRAATL